MSTKRFSRRIEIIGINPYVKVPNSVVRWLLSSAKKSSGPVPVQGTLNGKKFIQTVVHYSGVWRLYLNTPMRQSAGIDVGDMAHVVLSYDPKPRTVSMPRPFATALSRNKAAKAAFAKLSPSHQKEILRYLGSLKSKEALKRNIDKIIARLTNSRVDHLLWRSRK